MCVRACARDIYIYIYIYMKDIYIYIKDICYILDSLQQLRRVFSSSRYSIILYMLHEICIILIIINGIKIQLVLSRNIIGRGSIDATTWAIM